MVFGGVMYLVMMIIDFDRDFNSKTRQIVVMDVLIFEARFCKLYDRFLAGYECLIFI